MKNTTKFFEAVSNYRNEMRALQKAYQREMTRLEPFKGSVYYAAHEKEANDKRAAQLEALRNKHRPIFDGIINDMEKVYKNKPTVVPTQDQLALLQTLKLRDKVRVEEARQAANACAGCPAALEVLKEVAHKSGIMTASFLENSEAATPKFDILRKRTATLLSMDKVDNRREWINTGWLDDNEKFFIDADPKDEADCLRVMGGITDTASFESSVNAAE